MLRWFFLKFWVIFWNETEKKEIQFLILILGDACFIWMNKKGKKERYIDWKEKKREQKTATRNSTVRQSKNKKNSKKYIQYKCFYKSIAVSYKKIFIHATFVPGLSTCTYVFWILIVFESLLGF